MPFSQAEIAEEQTHFANVIQTFKHYAAYSLSANNRRRKDFFTLPRADQELLSSLGYKENIAKADRAIMANADFLNQIVADPEIFGHDLDSEDVGYSEEIHTILSFASHDHIHGSHSHSHSHSHDEPRASQGHGGPGKQKRHRPTDFDIDKLRSTLKQFVRDWSEEVARVCYAPMREALLQHFSDIPPEERHNFRVLVPGAGLGRLSWDVANLGFACQGNEFSHYMLLPHSSSSTGATDSIDQHTIYPYVHSFSNLPNSAAMLRPISIPDVMPSSLPQGSSFSLVAGDFEEIYGADDNQDEPQGGKWDAILTCFFIDTVRQEHRELPPHHPPILAPGGVWINLGPLLWHFENNSTNDPSIELNLEEVKALVRKIGFEISNERTIDTTYTNNAQSMLGYVYHAAFWTATKRI
ncbi:N2227-domain-containing protein [Fomitopsis serialis]|uniref:N2227-domain-containing protein n=1 Tax=Fomitopsis serialis TaxID=139415 RepID=UPI002008A300|nr:N2227-domain-containing protein [Neoantrodia serialis]KAH9934174.1 N2227-domain-containing protein [Neoantrodia serialis]